MKIRPARLEDAMAMGEIIGEGLLNGIRDDTSEWAEQKRRHDWSAESLGSHWGQIAVDVAEGKLPRSCIFVAVDEAEQVVGWAYGCPAKAAGAGEHEGEVDILYVRASHHRRGIGRALVQVVAAELARMGMTAIHIYTPVVSTQARTFYEALGGREIGIVEAIDDGEVIPLVHYEWADARELMGHASDHRD